MRAGWRQAALIGLALMLAACGEAGAEKKAKNENEPKDMRAKLMAMDPDPASKILIDEVRKGEGGAARACNAPELALLGDVPQGAQAHAAHVGARAWTVRCGPPGAPRFVVYLSNEKMEAEVEPCVRGEVDVCTESFVTDTQGVPPEDLDR